MSTFIFTHGTADAYSLKPYKQYKTTTINSPITYKMGPNLSREDSSDEFLITAWSNAMYDWNHAQDHFTYDYSSNSDNTLDYVNIASSTLYGNIQVNYNSSTGIINYFKANINKGNSKIHYQNRARSAASHELGHSLGLAHSSNSSAIMYKHRNRSSIYKPQTDDLNGITEIYGIIAR